MNRYSFIGLFIILLLLSGCGGDSSGDIKDYIENNNLSGFEETIEGVFVKITSPGNQDKKPKIGEEVIVHYRGYYTDGEEFDNSFSRGEPLTTNLLNVIAGWRIGIPYFGEGGSGTIIIPPILGYGNNPPGTIREDAILVFDIEVLEVR